MKKLLILGGGGAGMFSGIVATQLKPGKFKATILSDEKDIYCRCTTPYILTKHATIKEAIQPDSMIEDFGVHLVHEKAVRINPEQKEVVTDKANTYSYDKLVIATGARAFIPPIPGLTEKNSFHVRTSDNVKDILQATKKAKTATVIGGGIIGIEMAGALTEIGIQTTLIEREQQLLPGITDKAQATRIKKHLEAHKINVLLETNLTEVKDNKKKTLITKHKKTTKKIQTDLIIVATGVQANSEAAQAAGIKTDKRGNIIINNQMKTNIPSIYACGDCTTSKNSMTKEYWPSQLASVAVQQAKIVGYQLAGMPMRYHGHTDAYGFQTLGKEFAQVGLDEEKAKKTFKQVIVGEADTTNVYKDLKGNEQLRMKLIYAGPTMRLVGAQAEGKGVTGHIETASYAIGTKANSLQMLQYNYMAHPSMTPWPFMNPIIMASEDAMGKKMKLLKKNPILKKILP